MNNQILYTVYLAGSFLILFGLGELLYYKMNVKAELTRKFVHIFTGFITLLFPIFLKNHWLVLMLCASFMLILILSLKYNLLKSINAIDRDSVGSIVYPVSVYLCYLVYELNNYQSYFFYMPILILAVSDPIAALSGKKWPIGRYKSGKEHKTLTGSSMFCISAGLICYSLFISTGIELNYTPGILGVSLFIGAITSVVEGLSKKGYDNLSIPLTALGALILINQFN